MQILSYFENCQETALLVLHCSVASNCPLILALSDYGLWFPVPYNGGIFMIIQLHGMQGNREEKVLIVWLDKYVVNRMGSIT